MRTMHRPAHEVTAQGRREGSTGESPASAVLFGAMLAVGEKAPTRVPNVDGGPPLARSEKNLHLRLSRPVLVSPCQSQKSIGDNVHHQPLREYLLAARSDSALGQLTPDDRVDL